MSIVEDIGQRFRIEFFGRIMSSAFGAILNIALARYLGPASYGNLFLALAVLGMIAPFGNFGIAGSAARYISQYKETDPNQIPSIIRFSFVLTLGTMLIVSAGLILGHGLIATAFNKPNIEPLLIVGTLYVIGYTLTEYTRRILQGFESIRIAAMVGVTDNTLRLILAIGFVLAGFGAVGALFGYALSAIFAALFGLIYILKKYSGFPDSDGHEGLQRQIISYAIPLMGTKVIGKLDTRVDTILVGFFIGPIAVAYYTIARQVVSLLQSPISALGFTLAPTYQVQKSKGKSDTSGRLFEQALTHGLLLYIPAAAGLFLIADPLVEYIFGRHYLGAVPVLRILTLYLILRMTMSLTNKSLDFLGYGRKRAIIKTMTATLNMILNILLIPTWGVVGAAVATVTSFSIYSAANLTIMHSEFELRVRWLLNNFIRILAMTIVMSAVVYLTIGLINSIVGLLLVVSLGGIVWLTLAIATKLLKIREIFSVL